MAIATSTGGPAALQRILSQLPRDFPAPILVVQHISAGFVGGLSNWLNSSCKLHVKVAEDDEPLFGRTVYLAPDGRHLGVGQRGRALICNASPVNGFRPSATFLFESVARVYGAGVAAVMLTGMGNDGVDGLKAVKDRGGLVLAQDEASSVVYGMPREAAATGVVDVVVPLDEVAARLVGLVRNGAEAYARPGR
jgi:two-component system chemotaxis response regulator CheB